MFGTSLRVSQVEQDSCSFLGHVNLASRECGIGGLGTVFFMFFGAPRINLLATDTLRNRSLLCGLFIDGSLPKPEAF